MPDPLQLLPAEIVLRCVEFMPVSSVAVALNCTSKPWHNFLDTTHQDTIYSHQAHKLYNKHPRRDREVTLLHRDYNAIAHADKSFVHYFRHVHSWKDFCRRLLLLEKNWNSERPVTRESIVQVGYDPIWRFKTDFNRRFFISTSQSGGVCVTDMDTGRMLWRLTREHVRMCAHLEYDQESGIACWDRMGNAIEVWKADDHGQERGVFNRIATLNHDCETRGFQLSRFNNKPTLCVVSSEAKGFVWDLSTDPPQQTRILDIDNEAVGHLDQGEDTVMYSMGQRGYHVCSKTTGETLGKFDPKDCRNIYHITHPPPEYDSTWKTREHGPTTHVCPPQNPRNDRLTPLKLYNGPHPEPGIDMAIEDDEWGSGIISGNHMAGVSRGGRVFICTDFLGALADPKRFQQTTAILHTEGDGSTFELGGWLSIKNGRVIFEIIDHVYIFTLPDEGGIPEVGSELQRPIWATPIASAIQLAVPVSFMAIYDDSIMYTYTVRFWPPRPNFLPSTFLNLSDQVESKPKQIIIITKNKNRH
jgi:hypothetical protein